MASRHSQSSNSVNSGCDTRINRSVSGKVMKTRKLERKLMLSDIAKLRGGCSTPSQTERPFDVRRSEVLRLLRDLYHTPSFHWEPSEESIRNQLRDVDDSRNHDRDIAHALAQTYGLIRSYRSRSLAVREWVEAYWHPPPMPSTVAAIAPMRETDNIYDTPFIVADMLGAQPRMRNPQPPPMPAQMVYAGVRRMLDTLNDRSSIFDVYLPDDEIQAHVPEYPVTSLWDIERIANVIFELYPIRQRFETRTGGFRDGTDAIDSTSPNYEPSQSPPTQNNVLVNGNYIQRQGITYYDASRDLGTDTGPELSPFNVPRQTSHLSLGEVLNQQSESPNSDSDQRRRETRSNQSSPDIQRASHGPNGDVPGGRYHLPPRRLPQPLHSYLGPPGPPSSFPYPNLYQPPQVAPRTRGFHSGAVECHPCPRYPGQYHHQCTGHSCPGNSFFNAVSNHLPDYPMQSVPEVRQEQRPGVLFGPRGNVIHPPRPLRSPINLGPHEREQTLRRAAGHYTEIYQDNEGQEANHNEFERNFEQERHILSPRHLRPDPMRIGLGILRQPLADLPPPTAEEDHSSPRARTLNSSPREFPSYSDLSPTDAAYLRANARRGLGERRVRIIRPGPLAEQVNRRSVSAASVLAPLPAARGRAQQRRGDPSAAAAAAAAAATVAPLSRRRITRANAPPPPSRTPESEEAEARLAGTPPYRSQRGRIVKRSQKWSPEPATVSTRKNKKNGRGGKGVRSRGGRGK